MNDKRQSGLDPVQLDRLLGLVADRTDSTSDEDQTIRSAMHTWLRSPLDDGSTLPDPLQEGLSVIDKSFLERPLIELLLDVETKPTVLQTLAYCAQEYSLAVKMPSEEALALTLYYMCLASLLVFHHQESTEHSPESLVESFTDLKAKAWLPSELEEQLDRACKVCLEKQTGDRNETAQEPSEDQVASESGDAPLRDHSTSPGTQATLGRWAEGVGSRIGCYRLLRVLGEGGMGVVYLAEQEQLIRRRVALKIIKPGMDSKRVLARFEAERQALALLDHPNIAQVYDAGTAESGRPYFVMEYIKGSAITGFCDRHALSIEERLRLFQQVCLALQHAHQKGLIHRDIKPSNVLVSCENDQVTPKIIDFGVAKAVSQPLTDRTLITEESQLLGTPEYMSPEQVELANEDIDTRSDIYSLGVLLYELLIGTLPFDSETLRKGGVEHIRRIIRETDPKTPSTRLTTLGDEARKVAKNRRTEITVLAKCLRRELEWIPLKAMHKERTERYRSASEFADDIENYLKGDPLLAGPPSTVYRLKKFVRRNRILVTAALMVVAVLVVCVVVSTLLAIKAKREARISSAVSNFLREDLLASVSPTQARSQEVTVRSFLDTASDHLEVRFEGEPLVEAPIRDTLGNTYRHLGEYEKAELHLGRACQLYQEHLGSEDPRTLSSMWGLVWVYFEQGRYIEAEELAVKTYEANQRVCGEEDLATLSSMNTLAFAHRRMGRYEKAESLYDKMLKVCRRVLDEEHDTTVMAISNLAWVYLEQGRYDEAETLLDKAVRLQKRVWGEEHPWTLVYMSNLAAVFSGQGRYDEAEHIFVKTLEIQGRVYDGVEHVYTLWTMNGLARLYADKGQYDKAKKQFTTTLAASRRKLGEEHPDTLRTKSGLGVLLAKQKQYDEAEQLLTDAVHGQRLKLGDRHPHTMGSRNNLINLYEAWNKPEKARVWQEKLSALSDQSSATERD